MHKHKSNLSSSYEIAHKLEWTIHALCTNLDKALVSTCDSGTESHSTLNEFGSPYKHNNTNHIKNFDLFGIIRSTFPSFFF